MLETLQARSSSSTSNGFLTAALVAHIKAARHMQHQHRQITAPAADVMLPLKKAFANRLNHPCMSLTAMVGILYALRALLRSATATAGCSTTDSVLAPSRSNDGSCNTTHHDLQTGSSTHVIASRQLVVMTHHRYHVGTVMQEGINRQHHAPCPADSDPTELTCVHCLLPADDAHSATHSQSCQCRA
jgi:hypothetical protein